MTNEEAIKNIVAYMYYAEDIPEQVGKAFDVAIKALKDERPQGEWIVDEDNIFENFKKCSICNEGAEWLDGGSQFLSNFCPNCGADMRKGGAEE